MFQFIHFIVLAICIGLSLGVDDVSFVVVGLEPGLCNPSNFLPTDSQHGSWATEGRNKLNKYGKQQSILFGQYIRERYSFLSRDFNDHEFNGISCSSSVCQSTILSLYAGLYSPSPRDSIDSKLKWQPISMKFEDYALGISNVNCPYYENFKRNYLSSATMIHADSTLNDLSIYLGKNAAVNHTLQGLVDVFENWQAMRGLSETPPQYLIKPTLQGFTSESIYQKLSAVDQLSKQLCSNDKDCRRIASSYWLHKLLQIIEDITDRNSTLKLLVYVAETDNLLSLLKLLRVENATSTSNSGFFLEFRSHPSPSLRLVLHSPYNGTDFKKRYERTLIYQRLPFCDYSEWCSVDTFLNELRPQAITNHVCNSCALIKAALFLVILSILALLL